MSIPRSSKSKSPKLDLESVGRLKHVSKLLCKLVVENKQHKQQIDRADDVHLTFQQFLFITILIYRRHFNQNLSWETVNFSISSSIKLTPGMTSGVRSTWSSAMLVNVKFVARAIKPHFHATSFFFFLESEYWYNCPGVGECSPEQAGWQWLTFRKPVL